MIRTGICSVRIEHCDPSPTGLHNSFRRELGAYARLRAHVCYAGGSDLRRHVEEHKSRGQGALKSSESSSTTRSDTAPSRSSCDPIVTALINNTMAAIPQPGTGTTSFAARQPAKGSPLPLRWTGGWAAVAATPLAPVTEIFSPTGPGNRTRGRNRGQQAVGPVRVTRAACNEGYAHCPAGPPLAAQVLPAGAGAAAERLLLLEIDAHSRLRHPRFPRADASVLCFQSADGNKWRRARAGRGGEGA